jgi:WD40 repeat protein
VIWNVNTGKIDRKTALSDDEVAEAWIVLAVSASGEFAILGQANRGTLRRCQLKSGALEPLATQMRNAEGSTEIRIACAQLSSDGRRLYLCADSWNSSLRIVDATSGSLTKELNYNRRADEAPGREDEVYFESFALSPDEKTVLAGGWNPQSGQKVFLLSTEKEDVLRRLAGHADCMECAAFAPDGTRGATGSRDKSIRLWDLALEKQK